MRTGDCYRFAYRALMGAEPFLGLVLCHGVCTLAAGKNKGRPFGHAWLENKKGLVVDGGSGALLLKGPYYQVGKCRSVRRFTLQDSRKMALKTGIYGPWNSAIEKAERWMGEKKCAKR